jgi:hypothetical protein
VCLLVHSGSGPRPTRSCLASAVPPGLVLPLLGAPGGMGAVAPRVGAIIVGGSVAVGTRLRRRWAAVRAETQ